MFRPSRYCTIRFRCLGLMGMTGTQVFNRGINNKGAAFCSEWIAQAGGVPNPELYNPGTLRDLNRYLNEVVR